MTEAQLQRAVAQYLTHALPSDAVFFHPANEGRRSVVAGAELKRQGLLPGLPDVMIVWRAQTFAIELKARLGRATPIQKAVHSRLLKAGCQVAICRSIGEVELFLICCGFPLAARTAA